jgi:hypothetical protein
VKTRNPVVVVIANRSQVKQSPIPGNRKIWAVLHWIFLHLIDCSPCPLSSSLVADQARTRLRVRSATPIVAVTPQSSRR